MSHVALITGSTGGIGRALVRRFLDEGYRVIGSDVRSPVSGDGAQFIEVDLFRLTEEDEYRRIKSAELNTALAEDKLHVLVNNAALQIVGPAPFLPLIEWKRIMAINVTAPFVLMQMLFEQLESARGSIINISSIHEQLTKPGFAAYATSKAALTGLTRAMAVDIGDRVRVNAIAPAAIETDMLKAGFASNPHKLSDLRSYHPTGEIGRPEEVAELAVYMASAQSRFLNGSIVELDGGISKRLHDPV